MHLAELRQAIRQVTIASQIALVDLNVTRAIHRLDDERLLVRGRAREHVLAEAGPVARRLPKRAHHELRSVDLAVPRRRLLVAHELDERAEQLPALLVPEH